MAPRFNLRHPRLHTPSWPTPEWAFYVSDHLIIVRPWSRCARGSFAANTLRSASSLFLRKVTDWTPRWS